MPEDKERLMKLVEHWVQHNDEHSARYEEEAKEADGLGLVGCAKDLVRAAEAGRQVSIHLRSALRKAQNEGAHRSTQA